MGPSLFVSQNDASKTQARLTPPEQLKVDLVNNCYINFGRYERTKREWTVRIDFTSPTTFIQTVVAPIQIWWHGANEQAFKSIGIFLKLDKERRQIDIYVHPYLLSEGFNVDKFLSTYGLNEEKIPIPLTKNKLSQCRVNKHVEEDEFNQVYFDTFGTFPIFTFDFSGSEDDPNSIPLRNL